MSYFEFVGKNPRTLYGILKYVKNEEKTKHPLMYGFGLQPDSAYEEMKAVQKLWHQTNGRQYRQFFFSFDSNINLPDEILMKIGYEIGLYYANDYQILMTMHFNTSNIHIHYVLNTVNVYTGKKFRQTKLDLFNYKLYINQILSSYKLPLIEMHLTQAELLEIDLENDIAPTE
ncbi:mobilization protein [Sporomusaceae bacterium FL31]|nr:mobilization protein [Sporomusaceae bacterium FL31]GCE32618.1 mobilization protein [Sporomusaceae bacterium]